MSCFYVGDYVEPEKESVQSPGSSSMSSPLIDTERALGVLLGLSAASQVYTHIHRQTDRHIDTHTQHV